MDYSSKIKFAGKWEEYCQEVPTGSRRRTFVKEREKKCPTLGILQQGEQSARSPNAPSYEQLANCAAVY